MEVGEHPLTGNFRVYGGEPSQGETGLPTIKARKRVPRGRIFPKGSNPPFGALGKTPAKGAKRGEPGKFCPKGGVF